MPTIFDLLYREYCRACLVNLRTQLLIPADNDEALEADWDDNHPEAPADRDGRFGEELR